MIAILSDFEVGQESDTGLVDVSVSIQASGPVTWTATT